MGDFTSGTPYRIPMVRIDGASTSFQVPQTRIFSKSHVLHSAPIYGGVTLMGWVILWVRDYGKTSGCFRASNIYSLREEGLIISSMESLGACPGIYKSRIRLASLLYQPYRSTKSIVNEDALELKESFEKKDLNDDERKKWIPAMQFIFAERITNVHDDDRQRDHSEPFMSLSASYLVSKYRNYVDLQEENKGKWAIKTN
ncbi:hypothetical protein B0J14DRAFT_697768 [Halenospora varia]|nr:hypothetical protein B0J14DRAFT_697768 [Halenospora varia]